MVPEHFSRVLVSRTVTPSSSDVHFESIIAISAQDRGQSAVHSVSATLLAHSMVVYFCLMAEHSGIWLKTSSVE
jgi:hypothetical protein